MARFESGDDAVTIDLAKFSEDNAARTAKVTILSSDVDSLVMLPLLSPSHNTACDAIVRRNLSRQDSGVNVTVGKVHTYQPFVAGRLHCFTLPFRTTSASLRGCDCLCRELSLIHPLNNLRQDPHLSEYFESALFDKFKHDTLVINRDDAEKLKPNQCLNDSIINMWLRWLTTPRRLDDPVADVYVFSSHFLTNILLNTYTTKMQRWLKRHNIFQKKLLLFPFHSNHHWSLAAVLNPRLICQTRRRWGDESYTGEVASLIHLDPLQTGSPHNKRDIAWAIRSVLNTEWDKHFNTTLDKTSRPFTHRSMPLLSPRIFGQDNNVDCGVFTCKYAACLIQSALSKPIKMVDIMDRLDCFITKESAFQFNKEDIKRMRVELYNLLQSITHLFWNQRRVMEHDGNLSSDNDSDDSDVEIIDDPIGDDSTNTSGSRWSYDSDLDSDEEEVLVFEDGGKCNHLGCMLIWVPHLFSWYMCTGSTTYQNFFQQHLNITSPHFLILLQAT